MGSVKSRIKGRRRARAMRLGVTTPILLLLLGGCAANGPATQIATWEPPRGGFVTNEFAVAAEALAGRGDARLGHPPRPADTVTYAEVEQHSRLKTSRGGRVSDWVSRRERSTTIYLRP